jgi:hypothetical protein
MVVMCRYLVPRILVLLLASPVLAQEIDGTQCAAIDQPRINLLIRRQVNGPPLSVNAGGEQGFNVEAFLDTGASGVLLSSHTASALGVAREQANGADVNFNDVGVGGDSQFAVSEPLFIAMAPYSPDANVDDKSAINAVYTQKCGPLRTEIGPLGILNGLLGMLMGDLDVAGIPAMTGKIAVMNTKDVNNFSGTIRTTLYDAKQRSAVPKTSHHVQLTYVSFQHFTKTTPSTAAPPAIAGNPFIGPNPFSTFDQRPPLVVTHKGKVIRCSWLLDTGAAASMISVKQAAALGVTYTAGTQGGNNPTLDGVPADRQFVLSIGGIGGMQKSAGFFLDKLAVPTREGKPITYLHAPVLVNDITVKDPVTGKQYTLDGVFGMNFLVATANVDEGGGWLPNIGNLTPGPYHWIVFDQPAGVLGLE